MLSILTNINCEMKSMAVYSELIGMFIQFTTLSNESISFFSTASWGFKNQSNDSDVHIGSHDMHDI